MSGGRVVGTRLDPARVDVVADPPAPLDYGRPVRAVRTGRFSMLLDLRVAGVCAVLLAVTVAIGLVALATGDYPVALGDVVRALTGGAEGRVRTVVVDWRLPRVLLGVLLGAALGVSGAVFQSLTRNPLGSPDVIGFSTGAYTGALLVIISGSMSAAGVAAGALGGGLATAAAVYLLAYRRGVQGFRLIIVGIGVSAMLASFNTWLILTAELYVAMIGATWGAGSLNGVGWQHVRPSVIALGVLAAALVVLARGMRVAELGDDAAAAVGVAVGRLRLALVIVGVALTAVATAVAGPIAFVALAAPQLARRLARSAGTTLAGAAAMGALLLVASDFVARQLFAPLQLPVGIVTVCVGGLYLIWLLVREVRR